MGIVFFRCLSLRRFRAARRSGSVAAPKEQRSITKEKAMIAQKLVRLPRNWRPNTIATNIAVAVSFFGATLVAGTGSAFAQQQKSDFGKREYDSNCASCHGLKGKGDGPYKPFLTKSPSDLTVLSKKNGGVFPIDRVYSIIDGREQIGGGHGGDMPVWGREYSLKGGEAYFDVPYDPQAYVRTRILSLAEYISRLQTK
jgi:mono/diheme cytochrome c family protein